MTATVAAVGTYVRLRTGHRTHLLIEAAGDYRAVCRRGGKFVVFEVLEPVRLSTGDSQKVDEETGAVRQFRDFPGLAGTPN